MLLMMVVNHSPSQLRRFTDQPLGFFTTAEAFVFVSAFLAGTLFRRRAEKDGFTTARLSTLRRAWRIYRAHLLTPGFRLYDRQLFLERFSGHQEYVGSLRFVFRPTLSRERLGPNLAEVLDDRLRAFERRISCLALEFDLDRYRSKHKHLVAR